MFEWLSDPNAWLTLITLTMLEIVLGIDNIIFLTLVVAKLPQKQQNLARKLGLAAAMLMRLALLASITWIVKLKKPLFILPIIDLPFSSRDLVLLAGGVFLVWKGILEIKEMLSPHELKAENKRKVTFFSAILQIMILDIVFSLDSVITAIGLSEHLFIMMMAIICAVMIMLFAAKPIGDFVDTYPTMKMLALTFLVLIGVVLVVESFQINVPKAYIYFALFFSLTVEVFNLFLIKKGNKK